MQNVTIDRHKFIGGSDIPIIMGISPFKTRFDLLLEKAELLENNFEGNEYTEYGNIIEPQIRDYINLTEKKPFVEDKVEDGDKRYHSDGFNGTCVLEIKSTSQIKKEVEEYKIYLVQLLDGMQMHKIKKGKLAVYERPSDFNPIFNKEKLTTFDIDIKDYKELIEEINEEVDKFRIDLKKVKANPMITEEELQPKEIIEISNKLATNEIKLAEYKKIEKEQKELKTKLFEAMEKHNIKKWTTNNDTKITRVDTKEDSVSIVYQFNEDKFKKENEELYSKYVEKINKVTKGKKGYVLITLPKEV